MNEPVVTEADREKAREVILTGDGGPESWTQILAAALAEERAKARAEVLAERGTCGDTLPAHSMVGGVGLAICELPPNHSGWHQTNDDPAMPPLRWISAEETA